MLAIGLGSLSVWTARIAFAETDPADAALADSLFEEGRSLMRKGQYADACQKFAESQCFDPASGTLLNLSLCYELEGKSAAAWARYRDVIELARKEGRPKREEMASQRRNSLELKVARLGLALPPGPRLPGLLIALDEHVLEESSWNDVMFVEPGAHELRAWAPGRIPWTKQFEASPTEETLVVEVPVLSEAGPENQAAANETAPPPASPWGTSPWPSPSPPPTSATIGRSAAPRSSAQAPVPGPAADKAKTIATPLAYVVGGASVAMLGFGVYFGVRAVADWDRRDQHCPMGVCDVTAVAIGQDAKRAAQTANVMIGLGLVGIVLDAYWLWSIRSDKRASTRIRMAPLVAAAGAQLTIGGDF